MTDISIVETSENTKNPEKTEKKTTYRIGVIKSFP